ncbi:MAG: hypothetical protein L6Q93_11125 [Phycisphaerae bacterium]|nr:hypothetical protein [Phycisphaerae bacterium]
MAANREFTRYATDLQAYSLRLKRLFGSLGSLGESGIRVSRKHHISVSLRAASADGAMQGDEEGSGNGSTASGVPEDKLLEEWLREERNAPEHRPLLIVGPLGSGKSVIMESFAFRMAGQLEDWAQTANPSGLPLVPLPIRLRSLRYGDGELEHFRGFICRSQRILSPSDQAGLLSDSLLESLLDAGAVVCLFDGLDELPDATDLGDIRRGVLQAAAVVSRGFFVMASRPGCGAESWFGTDRQHTIQPLDEAVALDFIRTRLGAESAAWDSATGAYDCYPARVRETLSRPLFLAAWCESILEHPGKVPLDQRGIMLELYLQCFDHRRAALRLTRDERLSARHLLGALLKVFADSDFGARGDDEVRAALDRESGFNATEASRAFDIAMAMGLLVRVGRAAYFTPNTGPTEYLIAWYIVERLRGGGDGPAHFIHTFQRWVWLPGLNGLLETLAVLLSEEPELDGWLSAMIEWLTRASAHDGVLEDALRPFATLGLRLATASQHVSGTRQAFYKHWCDALVPPVEMSGPHEWFVPLDYGHWVMELVPDGVPGSVAESLLQEALSRLLASPEDYWGCRRWEVVIRVIARSVRPNDAAELVARWSQVVDQTGNGKYYWHTAAAEVCCQIPSSRALTSLRHLLHLFSDDENVNGKPAIIGAVARRVPLEAAGEEWLRLWAIRDGLPPGKARHLLAIACVRLSERLDADVVPQVVERFAWSCTADAEFREVWPIAAGLTAACVDPARCFIQIKQWLNHLMGACDRWERAAWLSAITEGAARVESEDAPQLVRLLLEASEACSDQSESSKLAGAAELAAANVPPHGAEELLTRWVQCWRGASKSQLDWRHVLSSAVKRLPTDRCRAVIEWLLRERVKETCCNELADLAMVIAEAAQCAAPEDASSLLERFVELKENASSDFMVSIWSMAAEHAVGRMGPADAALWMDRCLHRSGSDKAEAEAHWLIPALVKRVSDADADGLIRGWTAHVQRQKDRSVWLDALRAALLRDRWPSEARLCRQLLAAGLPEEAVAVASRSGSVALIRPGGRAGTPEEVGVAMLEVRARRDPTLLFDPTGVAAPELVRAALGTEAVVLPAGADSKRVAPPPTGELNTICVDGPQTMASPRRILKARELRILEYVAVAEQRQLDAPTQDAIGAHIHRSSDAARLVCLALERECGFIHRPDGARSGYRLTDAGRAFLRGRTRASE